MADYDNTNTGILFFNDEAQDKQPDWTGHFNYKGEEFKVAGWLRHGKKTGKEFISLKVDTYEKPEKSGYEKAKEVAEGLKKEDPTEKYEGYKDESGNISIDDIPFK